MSVIDILAGETIGSYIARHYAHKEDEDACARETNRLVREYATTLRAERDELQAALDRIAEVVGAIHDQSMGPSSIGTPAEILERVQAVTRERDAAIARAERGEAVAKKLHDLIGYSDSTQQWFIYQGPRLLDALTDARTLLTPPAEEREEVGRG